MCERLKQAVLKTAIPERVSGVRIPLPPPLSFGSFSALRISPAGSQPHYVRLHARKTAQLENRYTRKGIGGSNPSPSATLVRFLLCAQDFACGLPTSLRSASRPQNGST